MNNLIFQIGKQIAFFRNQKGLTQQILGQKVGLSQAAICQIEQGKRTQLNIQNLEKIASELDRSITDLIINSSETKGIPLNEIPQTLHVAIFRLSQMSIKKQEKVGKILTSILELP